MREDTDDGRFTLCAIRLLEVDEGLYTLFDREGMFSFLVVLYAEDSVGRLVEGLFFKYSLVFEWLEVIDMFNFEPFLSAAFSGVLLPFSMFSFYCTTLLVTLALT